MKAKLFSKTGALAGSEYIIEKEALIGRDNHCDITLYPHTVSSKHARIYLDKERGSFCLEDLGSSNGTFVDKTRVTASTALGQLHVITFAHDVDMIFQVLPAGMKVSTQSKGPVAQQQPGDKTAYQQAFVMPTGSLPEMPLDGQEDPGNETVYGQKFDALPEIPGHDDTVLTSPRSDPDTSPPDAAEIIIEDVSEAPPKPVYTLIINTIKETGVRVTLTTGAHVIGRSDENAVTIKDEYLSGRHAVLRIDAQGVFLKDLDSRNGTFVGDHRIETEQRIEKGDVFRLGPTTKIGLSNA